MLAPLLLLAFVLASNIAGTSPVPPFAKYPAPKLTATQPLALPHLRTPEERQFRTLLKQAVTQGYDVVEGGTEHERRGPNFAGHFMLVQWGCGSDCMEAAVIDALDGTILHLPSLPQRVNPPSFGLATGTADMRTLKFRTNSRLLGIPNRPDGMMYQYTLDGHRWHYIAKARDPEVDF